MKINWYRIIKENHGSYIRFKIESEYINGWMAILGHFKEHSIGVQIFHYGREIYSFWVPVPKSLHYFSYLHDDFKVPKTKAEVKKFTSAIKDFLEKEIEPVFLKIKNHCEEVLK